MQLKIWLIFTNWLKIIFFSIGLSSLLLADYCSVRWKRYFLDKWYFHGFFQETLLPLLGVWTSQGNSDKTCSGDGRQQDQFVLPRIAMCRYSNVINKLQISTNMDNFYFLSTSENLSFMSLILNNKTVGKVTNGDWLQDTVTVITEPHAKVRLMITWPQGRCNGCNFEDRS